MKLDPNNEFLIKDQYPLGKTPRENTVRKLTPSKKFVKIRRENGNTSWVMCPEKTGHGIL